MSDFFKQAMLDYVLGVNLDSFREFASDIATSDPGKLLQLSSIRTTAIESTSAQVLSADETRLGGWTLLSPTEPGTIASAQYEERVLLLTRTALFVAVREASVISSASTSC